MGQDNAELIAEANKVAADLQDVSPDWTDEFSAEMIHAAFVVEQLVDVLERVTPRVVMTVAELPDKLRIYLNTNITMTRGKAAAHAVHAALTAFGVHPGVPVVVLGAKPRDIEAMAVSIHDHGTTELEPGTLTAGTNWPNTDSASVLFTPTGKETE